MHRYNAKDKISFQAAWEIFDIHTRYDIYRTGRTRREAYGWGYPAEVYAGWNAWHVPNRRGTGHGRSCKAPEVVRQQLL